MAPLSPADITQIQQFPGNLGPDAALLQQIVGDAHAKADMLFLKKETMDVGENLRDMIEKERKAPMKPVKLKPGQQLTALSTKSQRLITDPAIVGSLGRTAAFDLLVGSNDRFVPNPEKTNLENIDFTSSGTAVVNLDQYRSERAD